MILSYQGFPKIQFVQRFYFPSFWLLYLPIITTSYNQPSDLFVSGNTVALMETEPRCPL